MVQKITGCGIISQLGLKFGGIVSCEQLTSSVVAEA